MAIVKMKKLRVLAMAEDREKLLDSLQKLGCVQISEPEPDSEAVSELFRRGESRLSETAMRIGLRVCAVLELDPYEVVFGSEE